VNAQLFKPGTAQLETESRGTALPQQVASPEPVAEIPANLLLAIPMGLSQTLPSARPAKLLFGALRDPEYRLRQPIPLELEVEESEVVLSWAEADEFGYGPTMGAALDDFGHTIRELYRRLHEKGQSLSSELENVKRLLDGYIEPRSKP